MAVFPMRTFGDPVLKQRAAEVTRVDEEVQKLIKDMIDTMRMAPGVGLAAPQIGILRRVIVWEFEGQGGALVNPVIVEQSDETEIHDEACLSVPGIAYPVVRARKVVVQGLDRKGEKQRLEMEDMPARIIQHEVDHIDGILFIDRLTPELRREAMRELREQTFDGGVTHAPAETL